MQTLKGCVWGNLIPHYTQVIKGVSQTGCKWTGDLKPCMYGERNPWAGRVSSQYVSQSITSNLSEWSCRIHPAFLTIHYAAVCPNVHFVGHWTVHPRWQCDLRLWRCWFYLSVRASAVIIYVAALSNCFHIIALCNSQVFSVISENVGVPLPGWLVSLAEFIMFASYLLAIWNFSSALCSGLMPAIACKYFRLKPVICRAWNAGSAWRVSIGIFDESSVKSLI